MEIKNNSNLKTRIQDLENSLKTAKNINESSLFDLQNQLLIKQREIDAQKSKFNQDYNQLLGDKNSVEKKLEQVKIKDYFCQLLNLLIFFTAKK